MPIRMAQYGTKHGHASGKARSMVSNPDTELVGIYEPDRTLWPRLEAAPEYAGLHWFRSSEEMLNDDSITAVAIEGGNHESLDMAHEAVSAGKYLWYDKPAGDNWESFQRLIAEARSRQLQVQMGYMFRYHQGFQQIASWARTGVLGDLFSVRAHMSTWLTAPARDVISRHHGGIFYDLAGHMLDQVVWLLGRPQRATAFFHNDATSDVPAFSDNTLGVFEFERAIGFVDIAAMETRPMARRFEVYGTRGSAIIVDPFEPGHQIRLCLAEASSGYPAGVSLIDLPPQHRQTLYDRELVAFVATLRGEQPPDRLLDHELLVQETLLRATGGIPE